MLLFLYKYSKKTNNLRILIIRILLILMNTSSNKLDYIWKCNDLCICYIMFQWEIIFSASGGNRFKF